MIFAGTPATTTLFSVISFVTTAPAPITTYSPVMLTPGSITAFAPTQQWLPTQFKCIYQCKKWGYDRK